MRPTCSPKPSARDAHPTTVTSDLSARPRPAAVVDHPTTALADPHRSLWRSLASVDSPDSEALGGRERRRVPTRSDKRRDAQSDAQHRADTRRADNLKPARIVPTGLTIALSHTRGGWTAMTLAATVRHPGGGPTAATAQDRRGLILAGSA
jgi:hypothetical protein